MEHIRWISILVRMSPSCTLALSFRIFRYRRQCSAQKSTQDRAIKEKRQSQNILLRVLFLGIALRETGFPVFPFSRTILPSRSRTGNFQKCETGNGKSLFCRALEFQSKSFTFHEPTLLLTRKNEIVLTVSSPYYTFCYDLEMQG